MNSAQSYISYTSKYLEPNAFSFQRTEHEVVDILQIDTTNQNSDINKTLYMGSETPAKSFKNCPYTSMPFYFYRTVRWNGTSETGLHLITVELHEQYPKPGRIWSITYDKNNSSGWYGWKLTESSTYQTPSLTFHPWIVDKDYSNIDYQNGICIVTIQIGISTGAAQFSELGFVTLNVVAANTAFGVLTDQNSGLSFDMHIYKGDSVIYLNTRGCSLPNSCYFRGQLIFRAAESMGDWH